MTATILVSAACGSTPGMQAGDGCNLRVAWDPYEPYSYASGGALPAGYDIDVVTKIAGMLDCSLDFTEMAWNDILVALESGDVDITVGTGYKPARADWSWYSESYRDEVVGLMIRAGTADEFAGNTLGEVFDRGLVFGKTTDDTYDEALEALFSRFRAQLRPRVSEQENVRRLLDGSIDGFLVEIHVGAATAARLGAADLLEYHPISFDAGAYRLQMSKRTVPADRVAEINAAIQQLEYSGWLAETMRGYGLRRKEEKR